MAILPVSHPDILEFIRCKHVEGKITNFNLSVGITDDFMHAVQTGAPWELKDPRGNKCAVMSAEELFDTIVDGGARNGEPGVLFMDAINRDNPLPDELKIEATNPCVTGFCVVNTSKGPEYAMNLVGVPFFTPDGVPVPKGFFRSKTVSVLSEVVTNMGYSIVCTPEHMLMTPSGWKEAKSLQTGHDNLVMRYGTYKTLEIVQEYKPPAVWSVEIAPILVGGFPVDDDWLAAVIYAIDTSTFKGAIKLTRELWETSGRPLDSLVFQKPVNLELVNSVQKMLFRLGVLCTVSQLSIQDEIWLSVTPETADMFQRIVTPSLTEESLWLSVWERLKITETTDVVASVQMVAGCGDDGEEDVFDATCLSSANKPILWTDTFLSHNCSEIPLSPYESCCLGSINLKRHVRRSASGNLIDWELLEETVHIGVSFLSNVIMANKFVAQVPQLEEKARSTMRIGLGVMGMSDVFFALGVRYGAPESISVATQIMEFIRYHAMSASMRLSIKLGPFNGFERSSYAKGTWQPPMPLDTKLMFGIPMTFVDIGRPQNLDWQYLRESISKFGLRNITTTAIAPTGTLSLVAGVSGFGCEPVFALSHRRRILGKDGVIRYEVMLVPELEKAIDDLPAPDLKSVIREHIMRTGRCLGCTSIPSTMSNTFVCASDISVTEHVMMQACLQRYVDGAISKTINMPPGSSAPDVKSALVTAWSSGCKGICVYVAGSRAVEVLTSGSGCVPPK